MTKDIVLSGTEGLMDDNAPHVSIAVHIESSGKPSSLVVTDALNVGKGAPVFLTKPIVLKGEKLKAFLAAKKINLGEKITGLIEDTTIACDAFYYANEGPQLMMFEIKFNEGVISTLIDPDLGDLFDFKGASARYIKCTKEQYETLKKYAAELAEE